jgi:hypothetical protein
MTSPSATFSKLSYILHDASIGTFLVAIGHLKMSHFHGQMSMSAVGDFVFNAVHLHGVLLEPLQDTMLK